MARNGHRVVSPWGRSSLCLITGKQMLREKACEPTLGTWLLLASTEHGISCPDQTESQVHSHR